MRTPMIAIAATLALFHAAPAAAQPLTQISAEAINQLRQGQTLLIRTHAGFPIAEGTQLLATASPIRGIVINQIIRIIRGQQRQNCTIQLGVKPVTICP